MNILRNLLTEAINHTIKEKKVDLYSLNDIEGQCKCKIFDTLSFIEWRGIDHGEIRFTIYWGIDQKSTQANKLQLLNGEILSFLASASGWLERKDGKWLQGIHNESITNSFCTSDAKKELAIQPKILGLGFKKSGVNRLM
jgi:hypothetical protein